MDSSLYLFFSASISHKQTRAGRAENTHPQIKWLNTVQSFKVFGFKIFCSCQKKRKKAKCFHSSNQTALTSYLNSSDRLPVMLCANTKGWKIDIDLKTHWLVFSLSCWFLTGSYGPVEAILLLHMLAVLNFHSFLHPWKYAPAFNHFPVSYPKRACTGNALFQPLLCQFPTDKLHAAMLRAPIFLCTTGHQNSFSVCQQAPRMYHNW